MVRRMGVSHVLVESVFYHDRRRYTFGHPEWFLSHRLCAVSAHESSRSLQRCAVVPWWHDQHPSFERNDFFTPSQLQTTDSSSTGQWGSAAHASAREKRCRQCPLNFQSFMDGKPFLRADANCKQFEVLTSYAHTFNAGEMRRNSSCFKTMFRRAVLPTDVPTHS